jgi:hypothetical protein
MTNKDLSFDNEELYRDPATGDMLFKDGHSEGVIFYQVTTMTLTFVEGNITAPDADWRLMTPYIKPVNKPKKTKRKYKKKSS